MANNKVQLANGTVLIDLTDTTAVASDVAQGKYFYTAGGVKTAGTASGGGSSTPYVLVTGEQDAGGGKIVHITGAVNQTISADAGGGDVDALSATVLLDLSDDTVDAAHLISGYTAHNSMGQPITGTASPGTAVLGTKSITENGTYTASSDSLDGYSSVTVNVPSGTPDLQTKTVSFTPSEAAQTQTVTPDTGKDGLSSVEVSVGAISHTYVGTLIARRSSSDLTVSDATITAPAGYYSASASKAVASGSASTPATSITANPSISVSSSGLITASVSGSQSVTPSVSAGYVSSGTAGTVSVSGSNTEQLTTMAAQSVTPTTSQQTVQTSGKYMTGDVVVNAIPSQYIVPSGTKSITENGTGIDVSQYASVDVAVPIGGTAMNVQVAQSTTRVASTTYTKTASLTCTTTGTYDVYWDCFRSSTSGTNGSQLYIGGSGYGTANTTFSSSIHVQNNHLSNVSISANQEVAVYVRSRATNYYAYCGQLTIVQTA